MKLTTRQLKQIIKEEAQSLLEMQGEEALGSLLQSEDVEIITQGLELSDILGIPVSFGNINQDTRVISKLMHHEAVKSSPEMLRFMAGAPVEFTWVRGQIARNKNTPVDVLQKLYDESLTRETVSAMGVNSSSRVRKFLAMNPNVPMEMLKKLSQDSHPRIRRRVPENPNVTKEILQFLSNDPVGYVRDAANKAMNSEV